MGVSTVFGFPAGSTPPTNRVMYNVVSPGTANTEFSQVLSTGTKHFTIKVRGDDKATLIFDFTTGLTDFKTIEPYCEYSSPIVNLSGKTLFMEVDLPSQTIEIEEWS